MKIKEKCIYYNNARKTCYLVLSAKKEDGLIYGIYEELIIRLLRDKPSMTKLNRTLASVAQQAENRAESKWLFDFDVDDESLMYDFVHDVIIFSGIPLSDIQAYKTPHGYAIVVPHSFNTRELIEKWKDYDITLKRDELLFLDMITKE